jgi:hypothetical protein
MTSVVNLAIVNVRVRPANFLGAAIMLSPSGTRQISGKA